MHLLLVCQAVAKGIFILDRLLQLLLELAHLPLHVLQRLQERRLCLVARRHLRELSLEVGDALLLGAEGRPGSLEHQRLRARMLLLLREFLGDALDLAFEEGKLFLAAFILVLQVGEAELQLLVVLLQLPEPPGIRDQAGALLLVRAPLTRGHGVLGSLELVL